MLRLLIALAVVVAVLVTFRDVIFQEMGAMVAQSPAPGASPIPSPGAPAAADATRATDAFFAAGREAVRSGNPPRLADAATRTAFDVVLDARALEAVPTASAVAETRRLIARLDLAERMAAVYLLAGTGLEDVARARADSAQAARVENNTVTFAPELGRIYDFILQASRALASAVQAVPAGEAGRGEARDRIAQARREIVDNVSALLAALRSPGIADAWRRERIVRLSDVAPTVARALDSDQQRQLREGTQAAANAVRDVTLRRALDTVATSFAPPR